MCFVCCVGGTVLERQVCNPRKGRTNFLLHGGLAVLMLGFGIGRLQLLIRMLEVKYAKWNSDYDVALVQLILRSAFLQVLVPDSATLPTPPPLLFFVMGGGLDLQIIPSALAPVA